MWTNPYVQKTLTNALLQRVKIWKYLGVQQWGNCQANYDSMPAAEYSHYVGKWSEKKKVGGIKRETKLYLLPDFGSGGNMSHCQHYCGNGVFSFLLFALLCSFL